MYSIIDILIKCSSDDKRQCSEYHIIECNVPRMEKNIALQNTIHQKMFTH